MWPLIVTPIGHSLAMQKPYGEYLRAVLGVSSVEHELRAGHTFINCVDN